MDKALFATDIEPKLETYIMSGIPGGSKIGEIMDIWITIKTYILLVVKIVLSKFMASE